MQFTQKYENSVAEQIRQKIAQYTLIEEKKQKHSTSKQKGKHKSIDQWNVQIPPPIKVQKTPYHTTHIHDSDQQLPFSEQLTLFLQSIVSEQYHKHIMKKLFYQAENQPLVNLWNSQYTNKLSFAIHHLTMSSQKLASQRQTKSNKPLQKNNKKPDLTQDNQNKNLSNIDSEQSDQQNQIKDKKKKKVKKSSKKVQSFPSNINDPSLNDNEDKNSQTLKNLKKVKLNEQITHENTLLNKESKIMIEQVNAEIDRVQQLYFAEMEQYHTLPYVEVDSMIQKNLKSTKIQNKTQNIKPQPQQIYPFQQGMQKSNLSNSNNLYPLSSMYSQRQDNPSMHDMNIPSQYFSFNQMAPQIGQLSMPFMQMNTSLGQINQQMGQYGHQGMMTHQVFANGGFQNNGFYDPNLMMMNLNSFGQSLPNPHQQTAMKTQSSGNNSLLKQVIMIENIEEEE